MEDKSLLVEDRPALRRSLSTVERQTLEKGLQIVSATATRLQGKGLSTTNFTLGVFNCLFVAWSFGCIPQHFWIVYILEACVLFPVRFSHQASAKPSEVAYWLDFCWVANFTSIAGIVALFLDQYHVIALPGEHSRKYFFAAAWGVGCGPLLLAGALLGNALIFHDADNVASVLIHLFPSLVLHTMRFHGDAVHKAWPSFHLDYLDDITGADIFIAAAAFYLVWATLYLLWLVSCGMSFPQRGYDTIFHYNMRSSSGAHFYKKVRGVDQEEHRKLAKNNDFQRTDALVYVTCHAGASFLGILTTLPSFWYAYFHGFITLVVTMVVIYNGAKRYTYYITKLYSKLMEEALHEVACGGDP
jgi:hypothetical protein